MSGCCTRFRNAPTGRLPAGESVGAARSKERSLTNRLTSFLALLLTAALLLGSVAHAWAEDEAGQGNGSLAPFPPGDVYGVQVIGDSLAEGILGGLSEALANEPRLKLPKKHRAFNGVMRDAFDADMKALEEEIAKEPFQIAVVMLGAYDRIGPRNAAGKRIAVGSDEWKGEYGRRLDRLMKVMRKTGAGVYWVNLPNMRRSDANDDAQMMNEIMRERAYMNGLRYIDSMAGFADEQGGYADSGPDVTGKIRRLREPDGVNFTDAGNRKLAFFVEKEVKRDLAQAKQDRNIPLAGDTAEQAAINAAAKALSTTPAPGGSPASATGTGWAPTIALGQQQSAAAGKPHEGAAEGAQKADNGRVSIKAIGTNGKEEVLTVDVLRPAIPASVVALVTRKESADKPSQMGDSLLDQIPGGLTVMSSIQPANDSGGARRKISPTQSPYFRVLVKGERVNPRPGRADDLIWPRPEPAPVPDPPAAAPAPAPAPAAVDTPKEPPAKSRRKPRDQG